jgi:hypothetical protein
LLGALRQGLGDAGVYVSDRRWRKIARVLRVAASCEGRREVGLGDCLLLRHCLWTRPEQEGPVRDRIRATLDAALVDEPKRFARMAEDFSTEIEKERDRKEQRCDEDGQLLFHDKRGALVTEEGARRQAKNARGELLFKPPPGMRAGAHRSMFTLAELWEAHFQNLPDGFARLEAFADNPVNEAWSTELGEPALAPACYAPEHVRAREQQVGDLAAEVRAFARGIEALQEDGAGLWVGDDERSLVRGRMAEARRVLVATLRRFDAILDLVRALPRRDA